MRKFLTFYQGYMVCEQFVIVLDVRHGPQECNLIPFRTIGFFGGQKINPTRDLSHICENIGTC